MFPARSVINYLPYMLFNKFCVDYSIDTCIVVGRIKGFFFSLLTGKLNFNLI